MRITIFGATGNMGSELVRQALYRNHEVRAFGRNIFTAGLPEDDKLELYKGALFDEEQVFHAVSGSDAVLSALGGSFDGSDKTRSLGMKNIITQMEKSGVQRIIAIGGKGQLDTADGHLLMDTPEFPDMYLPVSREHLKALEYLKASKLNWTFICSPDIITGQATGLYHVQANTAPEPDHSRIFSGDLAMFMLNELEKNEFIREKLGISN